MVLDQLQRVMSKDLNQNYIEQEIVIELKVLDNNRNYQRIKEAVKSLSSKQVEYEMSIPKKNSKPNKIQNIATSLVSGIKHERNSEYISFMIPSSACRFFCYIGGGFTTFQKTIALSLSSNYSKCMYELCCRWIDRGGYQCTIEEFRSLIHLGEKYIQISHLRIRVLEDSQTKLKKNADVYFSFSLNKLGGRYHSISFKFHRNQQIQDKFRGIDSSQFIFVYNFLNRFFPNLMDTRAKDYTDLIANQGNIDRAFSRFGRLDDDFTSGKKTKENIRNLLDTIILKEMGAK